MKVLITGKRRKIPEGRAFYGELGIPVNESFGEKGIPYQVAYNCKRSYGLFKAATRTMLVLFVQ